MAGRMAVGIAWETMGIWRSAFWFAGRVAAGGNRITPGEAGSCSHRDGDRAQREPRHSSAAAQHHERNEEQSRFCSLANELLRSAGSGLRGARRLGIEWACDERVARRSPSRSGSEMRRGAS